MRRTLKAFVSALLALISLCACAAENPFPEPIEDGEDTRVDTIERQAFYERAKTAYLVIQTGEERIYGNLLLAKGVIA